MDHKILINNIESIFTYYGESLDLMNPPDISNFKMYNLYHLFINNVLCIYKTNKSNKNIPVFWTIINNTEKLDRIPHPNSTLRRLDNNESYFIKLINNADLPIEIPQPIDIDTISCLNPDNSCKNNKQNTCCSTPSIIGESFRNIQLTDSYFSNITVPLSGLLPNKKYFYKIDNNFSNWPAKIHPYSGFLERSGPTNDQLELIANLEFVFSYLAEEDVGNIQVTTPTDDTSNIFTFLTLSLWQEGCDDKTLLSDTINISCKNCLTSLPVFDSLNLDEYSIQSVGDCATIKFDNNNIVTTTNKTSIRLFYENIDISKKYSYSISSKDANWPLSISSNSGTLIPKEIYPSGNKLYGSGIIDLQLHFSDTNEEPYLGWSNLDYTLDENANLNFIRENIYAKLEASIFTNICLNTDKITIFCDDCLLDNSYDCIKDLNVNINNTSNNYYDLKFQRPGAESGINLECCKNDINLNIIATNVCPEEEYFFKIESYPPINILPSSGSFFSSSDTFAIQTLANMGNEAVTNIQCFITHKASNYAVSDSMILKCRYCEWQRIKILDEIYSTNNYREGYYNHSIITGNTSGSKLFMAIPSGYLYKSEDYGINWTPLTANGKRLWSSIAYSEDTSVLYATIGSYQNNTALVGEPGLFLKSIDEGDTFQTIPDIVVPSIAGKKPPYHGLDISNDGNYISLTRGEQLIYSTDAGATFLTQSYPLNIGSISKFFVSQTSIANNGKVVLSFAIKPANQRNLNSETNAPIITTNVLYGDQNIIDVSSQPSFWKRIAKYSKDGSILMSYVETFTSIISISRDDGFTWDATAFSLEPVIINDSAISDDGSIITLVTASNIIFKSIDYGQHWTWFNIDDNSDHIGLHVFGWNNLTSLLSINKYNSQYGINLYNCSLS